MYEILSALARIVAPLMPFTADEIWRAMPGHGCRRLRVFRRFSRRARGVDG